MDDPRKTIRPETVGATEATWLVEVDRAGATAEAAGIDGMANFELGDVIGQGEVGIVYRAWQGSLHREVAVKRIPPDQMTEAAKAKFLAEALITGGLDHPNIVPIHELGTSGDGSLFLAMKHVDGRTWDKILKQGHDLDRDLAILKGVCNAAAFAHLRGVVHRDLKPENVMVGEFGEVLVTGWSLAVDVRENPAKMRAQHKSNVTAPAGTPSYMAPELAMGHGHHIGPHTDVYLLGAILHELLTGRPPHVGESVDEVLRAAASSEPQVYGAGVPSELQTICHKAMSADPGWRYASAEDFRDAIAGFLKHRESRIITQHAEDVLAHCSADFGGNKVAQYMRYAEAVAAFRQALLLWPENPAALAGEQTARTEFARTALENGDVALAEAQEVSELSSQIGDAKGSRTSKKRTKKVKRVGLLVTAAVLFVAMAVGIFIIRKEGQRAAAQRDRAIRTERKLSDERDKAVASMKKIKAQRDQWARTGEDALRRGWTASLSASRNMYDRAFTYARRGAYGEAAACLLRAVELAPEGGAPRNMPGSWARPAWADEAWLAYRYLAAQLPKQHESMKFSGTRKMAFHPGGKALALGDGNGVVHIVDPATRKVLRKIQTSTERATDTAVQSMAFSPDGRYLLTGTHGLVEVWDYGKGRRRAHLAGHRLNVRSIGVCGDNRTAVSLAADGARAFDLRDGSEITRLQPKVVSIDAVIALPNRAFKEPGAPTEPDEPVVFCIGQYGGNNGYLWRIKYRRAFQMHLPFGGRASLIRDVARGPTGATLAFAMDNGDVGVWTRDWPTRLATGRTKLLRGHKGKVRAVAVSPSGQSVLSGAEDRTVRLWDVASGRAQRVFEGHKGIVRDLAFHPSGEIAVSADDKQLRFWDVRQVPLRGYHRHNKVADAFAVSPNGRWAVICHMSDSGQPMFTLHDMERGRARKFKGASKNRLEFVGFGPESKRFYVAAKGGPIDVWSISTGKRTSQIKTLSSKIFFPEHNLAVFNGKAYRIVGSTALFSVSKDVTRAAVSGDGKRLVVVTPKGLSRYSVPDGKQMGSLKIATASLKSIALDETGARLLLGYAAVVYAWDFGQDKVVTQFKVSKGDLKGVSFGPSGRLALVRRVAKRAVIEVRDARTGVVIRKYEGQPGFDKCHAAFGPKARSVIFSLGSKKDGHLLARWPLLGPEAPDKAPRVVDAAKNPFAAFAPFYKQVGLRVERSGAAEGRLVKVK